MSGGSRVVPLAPDASTRRFFRVVEESGSHVAMEYGHPLDASGEAYLSVGSYLEGLGVPVPRVLDVDREAGRILIEDLGDVMLEHVVLSGRREEWLPLYEQAIDILIRLQEGAAREPSAACPAFSIRLDEARLLWELEFFIEHFLEGFCGLRLSEADRAELSAGLGQLARSVGSHPVALCHRDYHSRNIMVRERRLYLVDFQDARIGPRTYDLASLLRDSYVTIDEGAMERLASRFTGGRADEAFLLELHEAGMQRNLKALGTFGYQIQVMRRDRYRDAVPRTLAHLARFAPTSPGHEALLRALSRFLPGEAAPA